MSATRARAGRAALGAAGAAALALAARQLLRRRSTGEGAAGPVSVLTRRQRMAQLGRIGTRAGGALAVHRARRVFASAERRDELDTAFELRTAESITEALGNMKGALMKVGQMASYLDQGLPDHVRDAFAQLQADAPPMSAELAEQVIRDDLGRGVGELFAEWDPVPIASASIGQVHRAITHDGVAAAVKVQYPGVGEAIRADLENADLLFQLLNVAFPGLDPEPLVQEIRERLHEELDYRLEADNQRLFAREYEGHPTIHVPGVIGELSSERVLTTELAEGARFEEVLGWAQEEKDLAAETIYRFVFRGLYRMRAFNGDPHPGNYLFRPGGHVTFLDFGLVKHFDDHDIEVFGDMVQAMVLEQDPARYRALVEHHGILEPGLPYPDEQVHDYFRHFYESVLSDEVRTLDTEYASEMVRRFFDPSGAHGDIMRAANVPPAFVITQRINLGLFALLGQLEATANWRRIGEEIWPFVDGPPSTSMGEAEATWAAARTEEVS